LSRADAAQQNNALPLIEQALAGLGVSGFPSCSSGPRSSPRRPGLQRGDAGGEVAEEEPREVGQAIADALKLNPRAPD